MNNDDLSKGFQDLPYEELTQYLAHLKNIILQMQQAEKKLSPEEAALYTVAMEKMGEKCRLAKEQFFLRIRNNMLTLDTEQRIAYLRMQDTPHLEKIKESFLLLEDYEICEAIRVVLVERDVV